MIYVSHRLLPASALLLLLILAPPPAVYAEGDKVGALIKDYGSISHDLHKAQQTQSVLLKQKAALDVRGSNLSKRQDALNNQANAHNAEAAAQQRALAKSKSDCNNSNQNSSGQANACDNNIKKLNQKTADLNATVSPLQQQQSELDLEYGQYNQAANDWTAQENENTTSLNALYRALNDWADRADDLMGSAAFHEEMESSHADQVCAYHTLPDGMLSIEDLQHYAAGAERCLRYIDAQRHKTRTGS